ncbi:MAG: pyridine nucleotide-disulfide oxidoreductase [candidate division Zixibacteria bacterium]|nr:pyridine nucleotide-disulfide oxidoreductase [candidate division Zixibacteria bacterium]
MPGCVIMPYSDVVIVGGVAAGPKTAATVKRRLPDARVTLFQKGAHLSFASCGMPFFAAGDVQSFSELTQTGYGVPRDTEFFRSSRGCDAVTGVEVIDVDRNAHTLTLRRVERGETFEHQYGKLVLATGAHPVDPPFPVVASERIRTFHSPEDAMAFRKLAESGAIDRAIIVGGGFIGCELAEAVGSLWGIETVLIECEAQLLKGTLDPEMSALVEQELRKQDVELHLRATVTGIELNAEDQLQANIDGGATVTADYVFLALGVRPQAELAERCGLAIGACGGIVVNAQMQTSDPDIYAGGDCVESVHQLTGKPLMLYMGSIANRHGRVIAENLAGGKVQFPGVLGTRCLRVFDLNVGAVGLTETAARDAGFDVQSVHGSFPDKPDYQPEVKTMVLKMIFDGTTMQLLGLQAVGEGDIIRRLDTFAAFLQYRATVDSLFDFEHAYAPPYAEALDPLHHLAGLAHAVRRGQQFVRPGGLFDTISTNAVLIVDVREDEEAEATPLPGCWTANGTPVIRIPLGQLRSRLDEVGRDRPIVLVCQRGARSYQAAYVLKGASIEQVTSLAAGLQAVTDH